MLKLLHKNIAVSLKINPFKNVAIALLLTLFLGPLGLLYASVFGGIIMILVAFVVLSNHFSVPIIIMWIICCVWSVIAVNRHNKKILMELLSHHEEKNMPSSPS